MTEISPSVLTYEDTVLAVKHVVQGREGVVGGTESRRVNSLDGQGSLVSPFKIHWVLDSETNSRQPSCIVGYFFDHLNLLGAINAGNVGRALNEIFRANGIKPDFESYIFLHQVQAMNDADVPWGEVIKAATQACDALGDKELTYLRNKYDRAFSPSVLKDLV